MNQINMVKEFSNEDIKKLIRVFSKWERSNLIVKTGKRESDVTYTYGLPYTSTGAYAGLWNTNAESVFAKDEFWFFDGIGYNDKMQPVAFFTKRDKEGNEIESGFFVMNRKPA